MICIEIKYTAAQKLWWVDSTTHPPRLLDRQNIPALLGLNEPKNNKKSIQPFLIKSDFKFFPLPNDDQKLE